MTTRNPRKLRAPIYVSFISHEDPGEEDNDFGAGEYGTGTIQWERSGETSLIDDTDTRYRFHNDFEAARARVEDHEMEVEREYLASESRAHHMREDMMQDGDR